MGKRGRDLLSLADWRETTVLETYGVDRKIFHLRGGLVTMPVTTVVAVKLTKYKAGRSTSISQGGRVNRPVKCCSGRGRKGHNKGIQIRSNASGSKPLARVVSRALNTRKGGGNSGEIRGGTEEIEGRGAKGPAIPLTSESHDFLRESGHFDRDSTGCRNRLSSGAQRTGGSCCRTCRNRLTRGVNGITTSIPGIRSIHSIACKDSILVTISLGSCSGRRRAGRTVRRTIRPCLHKESTAIMASRKAFDHLEGVSGGLHSNNPQRRVS